MISGRLIVTAIAVFSAVPVAAQQCRSLQSVQDSAFSVTANTTAGGHVEKHIPPPKTSYSYGVGNTLFLDETQFRQAWNGYLSHGSAVCSGNANVAEFIAGTMQAKVCSIPGCGNTVEEGRPGVRFVFKNLGGNKWILLTAFPAND